MKKIDPTGYQIMVDGREKLVTDCTREELMQSVCESINVIEILDSMTRDTQSIIEAWRRGKPIPSVPGYEGEEE